MGIFDNLKSAFGGKKDDGIEEATKGPSQILRENGIDPSGLKFSFESNGVVGVRGEIEQESDRQKIVELLEATRGISSVKDNMIIKVETPPEPEVPSVEEPEPAASSAVDDPVDDAAGAEASTSADEREETPVADDTYTVQSGDTLWKIASNHYGDGSKYMKIYEANTDLLENPDRIFPGQELKIPKLDD